ncbi:MAG: CrcB family protein [Bacteroidetes bacterium]|nr:CrcB family protein [Bacteroidota bacterium]
MNWLMVFIGGGLGCIARHGINVLLLSKNLQFPLATLIVNALSCFIMGLMANALLQQNQTLTRMFLLVGLCGGFSTFSAFTFESMTLIQQGNWSIAGVNIIANMVLCILTFLLGSYIYVCLKN